MDAKCWLEIGLLMKVVPRSCVLLVAEVALELQLANLSVP